jgi:hypothetical protein
VAITIVAANSTNDAPTISGTPGVAIAKDSPYSFTPSAVDVDLGDTLIFSIANQPTWANFNPTTGQLSGTPTTANVGTTSGIVISVTGSIATTALSPFALDVTSTILRLFLRLFLQSFLRLFLRLFPLMLPQLFPLMLPSALQALLSPQLTFLAAKMVLTGQLNQGRFSAALLAMMS